LNHSCDPNVLGWPVEGTKNILYYSSKPIRAGDEICLTHHTTWAEHIGDKESLERFISEDSRKLKIKWEIVCPPNCVYNDLSILPGLIEFSKLSKIAIKSGSEGDFRTSLAASKKRLQLCNTHPRLIGNLWLKFVINADAYSAATTLNGKTGVKEVEPFLNEFNEVIVQLEFPGSEKSRQYEIMLNDPPSTEFAQGRFCTMYNLLFNGK